VLIAERTFRIRVAAPAIAAAIRPGQFVMLRIPQTTDPLLGRPFALYDVVDDAIDIVYLVVGKMTARLAEAKAGEVFEVSMDAQLYPRAGVSFDTPRNHEAIPCAPRGVTGSPPSA